MIILGIDPGTRRIGYGIVETGGGGAIALQSAGILPLSAQSDTDAILETKRLMDELLARERPSAAGVEKLFFSKNEKTAIAVAQARGVILLALAEADIPVVELTPNEVKSRFTGYGAADKTAVAKMVRLTLGSAAKGLPDDATDAVAIAVCAAQKHRG